MRVSCAVMPAVAVVLAHACGGGPAAPAPPARPAFDMPEGRYHLSVRAPFSLEGCTGAWENFVVSVRSVQLLLKREGDEWVARAELPLYGDAVFRLHDVGPGAGPLRNLAGSIEGLGITAGDEKKIDLGVRFNPAGAGPAAASGVGFPSIASANGTLTGAITFLDSRREPMTCQTVYWSLSSFSGF